jgi:hypothetical protein
LIPVRAQKKDSILIRGNESGAIEREPAFSREGGAVRDDPFSIRIAGDREHYSIELEWLASAVEKLYDEWRCAVRSAQFVQFQAREIGSTDRRRSKGNVESQSECDIAAAE